MPQTPTFITNLLEMRSHYQGQIQQYDRAIAHAQDGLSHVNALLVDEALDNQQFAANLLQMRSHYQAIVDEQKRSSASAKEQLLHINALLVEQMATQHNDEQTISMLATAHTDNPVLTAGIDGKQLPTAADQNEPTPAAQEQVQLAQETQAQQRTNEPDQISSPVIAQGDPLDEMAGDRLESLPMLDKEATANNTSKAQLLKTPLLPQYQHLTRSEAVEQLLQENIGTILHTDYIVRSLYGNLEKEAFKVEKQRLYETLGKGIAKGLWDRVPDQPGCYTIDLKLVDKQVQSKQPATSGQAKVAFSTAAGIAPKNNPPLKLLPTYQHLNFTQAVETVLRENAGQIMNSDKVARTLYGDLETKDLSKAKDKVGKILWAGARQKRWQSVAGKLGAYTMSSEGG